MDYRSVSMDYRSVTLCKLAYTSRIALDQLRCLARRSENMLSHSLQRLQAGSYCRIRMLTGLAWHGFGLLSFCPDIADKKCTY